MQITFLLACHPVSVFSASRGEQCKARREGPASDWAGMAVKGVLRFALGNGWRLGNSGQRADVAVVPVTWGWRVCEYRAEGRRESLLVLWRRVGGLASLGEEWVSGLPFWEGGCTLYHRCV